jgi:1,4-alpha-glucan branching enzyme
MRWINLEIKSRQPWKISIAEDLRNNAWITRKPAAGGAGFDAQWDAGFAHPVREALVLQKDSDRNMGKVRDTIAHFFNRDAFERVIYTESHDEVANGKARLPQEISPESPASYYAKKRSTLGAVLVFTSPGIPMIFQGQEFLEDEWFRDTDPIDWKKKETFRGILNLYGDLIRLRRNWYNNTRGLCGQHVNVYHLNNNDKVIAFHRWDGGGPADDVVVMLNMANRSYNSYRLGFPRRGLWKLRFNSDWKGYSEDFGNHPGHDVFANAEPMDNMAYNGNAGIGAFSALIFSQDG